MRFRLSRSSADEAWDNGGWLQSVWYSVVSLELGSFLRSRLCIRTMKETRKKGLFLEAWSWKEGKQELRTNRFRGETLIASRTTPTHLGYFDRGSLDVCPSLATLYPSAFNGGIAGAGNGWSRPEHRSRTGSLFCRWPLPWRMKTCKVWAYTYGWPGRDINITKPASPNKLAHPNQRDSRALWSADCKKNSISAQQHPRIARRSCLSFRRTLTLSPNQLGCPRPSSSRVVPMCAHDVKERARRSVLAFMCVCERAREGAGERSCGS